MHKRQRIILGVTGGIAAYKAAELVRLLRDSGAEVQVVMTHAATHFVGAATFQALSGSAVRGDLWDEGAEAAMGHIELARWADRIIVAPATANFLAKLAHGIADDLLTTLCLATTAPLFVAPAMNQAMWLAPATLENVDRLVGREVGILGPASGEQACGDVGPGRMLEPREIVASVSRASSLLSGVRVLLTAGPTREAIDPVRYLSNHSSGKMGYALAEAAKRAGAEVTLVSGPTNLPAPAEITFAAVVNAREMYDAVFRHLDEQDLFIATAAVADYAPEHPATSKLKRSDTSVQLVMRPNPDILKSVAALGRQFTVGFAAETDDLDKNARKKLADKKLDMLVANQVGAATGGFGRDDNQATVYWRDGQYDFPLQSKVALAAALVRLIAKRFKLGINR